MMTTHNVGWSPLPRTTRERRLGFHLTLAAAFGAMLPHLPLMAAGAAGVLLWIVTLDWERGY